MGTSRGFQRRLAWVALIFCLICSHNALQANAVTLGESIDRIYLKWDRSNTPGVVVAVVQDGHLLHEKGYGMANLTHGIPLSATTVLHAGSVSKQFTAFAILLLEQEGKISQDDDVFDYFPEFLGYEEKMTIRHLIYHTSGLRDYLSVMAISGWNLLDDLVTLPMGLRTIGNQKGLNHSPGESWSYTNSGYLLMAEIVQRVSGKTFAEFCRERIFDPLGMKNSHFRDNYRLIAPGMADSYDRWPDGKYYISPTAFSSVGEGGLFTTAEDLLLWDQNFYDHTVGGETVLARMHDTGLLNNGQNTHYGGGLIVMEYNGRKMVYHGGDIAGFHANILRFPDERFSVIQLANTSELTSDVLAEQAIQIADFHFSRPPTSIPNFMLHDPSLRGVGQGTGKLLSDDADFFHFLQNLYRHNLQSESAVSPQTTAPMMSADQAQEYLGKYYSEETDVFYTLTYNETSSNLIFNLPRSESFISLRTIRRDEMIFPANSGISGRFYRNAENEVAGMRISISRAENLEFRRAQLEFTTD